MRKTEITKKFIIEKTAPVFNKKGFVGTSLSDLTSATGLTKGSIYGNFKNKNEVAVEAFKYNYEQVTSKVITGIHNNETAKQKLLSFLSFYKQNYQTIFKNGGCAILNTAVDSDDGNPLLKREVKKAIQSWEKSINKIIQEGIEKKELKNIDPNKFASKMIALIEGSIMLSKITDRPEYLLNNIEYLEGEIERLS